MTNLEKWKARKAELLARQNEIVAAVRASNPPRTFSPDENVELEVIRGDLDNISAHIETEQRLEIANLEPARPRGVARAPAILNKTNKAQRDGDKFAGASFMAYVRARALMVMNSAQGDISQMAKHLYRDRPEYQDLFRIWAANEVPGGGEKSGEWGAELVAMDGRYTGDFISYLRSKTCFDQLGLRDVPANVTIKGQDGTGVAYWLGQGKAIPMSKADYSTVNLQPLKLGALSAISMELIRDSSPAALQLVMDSLTHDHSQLIDTTFFSASAAVSGVSPAGIVNGVSGTAASGTDLNGLITDMDVLVQAFITAKNTGGTKFVSRPTLAQKIAGFTNFAGSKVYPGLSDEGGTLENKPYLVSDNVVSGDLLLIKPQDVYKIGDDGLSIDISKEASLEFASDPTGSALANGSVPVSASKQVVNLFQNGMVGIRLLRSINWAKRRSSAVARITGAAYVPQVQTA